MPHRASFPSSQPNFGPDPSSQPNFGLNPSYQIWNPIFSARLRTEPHCHNEVKALINSVDWREFLILLVNTLSLPTLVSITILKPILSSSFLPLDRKTRQFSLPIYLKLLQRPVQSTHAHALSNLDGPCLTSYSYQSHIVSFFEKRRFSFIRGNLLLFFLSNSLCLLFGCFTKLLAMLPVQECHKSWSLSLPGNAMNSD